MTRFWMVTRKPEKQPALWGSPKHRHYTRKSAVKEARRLAKMLDRPFVVLGCEEVFVPPGTPPETLVQYTA